MKLTTRPVNDHTTVGTAVELSDDGKHAKLAIYVEGGGSVQYDPDFARACTCVRSAICSACCMPVIRLCGDARKTYAILVLPR